MPSAYKPPKILHNGHFQTIYPALFRRVQVIPPVFNRVETDDNDFIDLCTWKRNNNNVAIISHGLEGDYSRPYILGMAKAMYENGFDCIAWNYRSCSEEMNKSPIMYHSGATYDLDFIINIIKDQYQSVTLIGFSLGGNLTLKYLGERSVDPKITKAVAISAPLHLKSGSLNLNKGANKIYERRFLKSLKNKLKKKHQQYPELIDLRQLKKVKNLYDFDDKFTSVVHGFKNAEDYYSQCSSAGFLDKISVKTLILNASNDPMLTEKSLDVSLAKNNPWIEYELTSQGGHCGFGYLGKKTYWSEKRVLKFLSE